MIWNEKKPLASGFFLLRRAGSNHRPSGYEPDELPLLYSAIYIPIDRSQLKSSAKVLLFFDISKFFLIKILFCMFFNMFYSESF